jgi:hypothetical protein
MLTKQNSERQQTWRHAQNIVSLRVLYQFVNLISTVVICLIFVFIEMLNKLITYTVCLYKTLYQVLPVVWTNRITTRRYRDSWWYWFTQQARPDTKSCPSTLCMKWICIFSLVILPIMLVCAMLVKRYKIDCTTVFAKRWWPIKTTALVHYIAKTK